MTTSGLSGRMVFRAEMMRRLRRKASRSIALLIAFGGQTAAAGELHQGPDATVPASPGAPAGGLFPSGEVAAARDLLRTALAGRARPGGVFRTGKYECLQVNLTKRNDPSQQHPFALNFYPNGEFRVEYPKSGWASWLKEGSYSYLPQSGQLNIQYGSALNMENYDRNRETTLYYADDKAAVIVAHTPVGYGYSTTCAYAFASVLPSPSQQRLDDRAKADDPETYLQPASVRAPAPPPGSGGVSGLYWTTAYNQLVGGLNGMVTRGMGILPFYFTKNGYYHEDFYLVGYDSLDCSRVRKDGSPLCGTYRMHDGIIELSGNKQIKLTYSVQADGGIVIKGYNYVPPSRDLYIEGSFTSFFAMTNAPAFGPATGVAASHDFQFFNDGTFFDSSSTSTLVEGVPAANQTNKSKRSGRYSINNYTLELRYADGRVVKRTFFVNTKDSVYINGKLYTQSK